MKILTKIFFLFLILFPNQIFAETFYIDLDKIINQSKPGKYINEKIANLKINNDKVTASIKENIKKREEELISQKNIISENEFNDKLNELKLDINKFNNENQKRLQIQQNKSISYKRDFLKLIEPLLLDYVSKNNIKYLLQKKYIIVGHNDLNKTQEIIEIVNQKINNSNFDE